MADREGARKTPQAMVLSTCPDVCKTPMGPNLVPVPYPIVAYCHMITGEAQTVNMTGCKVVTKATKITCVFGDEPGVGGGVKSSVNKSIVEFVSASSTVYCEKQPVIRHLDDAQMNNGNVPGKVQYPLASGGGASEADGAQKPNIDENGEVKGETNPTSTTVPETPKESGFVDQFNKRFNELEEEYSSMAGTARDAIGFGKDGSLATAWGKIWDGTKALGSLGLDAATVAIDMQTGGLASSLAGGSGGIGEMLNPGAADRLQQVGTSMVNDVASGYRQAYAEGGLGGALGRGTMDAINLGVQALTTKGVGKMVEAGGGMIKGAEVLEGAATKVDDLERAASKVDDVERAATKTDDVLASQGGQPPSGGGRPPEGGGGSSGGGDGGGGGGKKGGGNGADEPPDDPGAPKEPEKPKKPEEGGSSGGSGNNGTSVTKPSKPPISTQKQAGHVKGTPQYNNRVKQGKPTSAFENAEDADKFTQEAWEKGSPVPGRPGVKDFEFGSPVGTGPNGGSQSKVRVHMDSQGKIHGHPAGPER